MPVPTILLCAFLLLALVICDPGPDLCVQILQGIQSVVLRRFRDHRDWFRENSSRDRPLCGWHDFRLGAYSRNTILPGQIFYLHLR